MENTKLNYDYDELNSNLILDGCNDYVTIPEPVKIDAEKVNKCIDAMFPWRLK